MYQKIHIGNPSIKDFHVGSSYPIGGTQEVSLLLLQCE